MEWFGLTMYGFPDPIKTLMREEYREPTQQRTVYDEIAQGTKKSFSDLIAEIDVYIGRADGYSYKSIDRLQRMRQKGVLTPKGPTEKYRFAVTDAQNFSFWRDDCALQGANWYKQTTYKPRPATEISRFVEAARKVDKFFKM